MSPLQSGLAAIDDATPLDADEDKQLVAAKCRGLLRGYAWQWMSDAYDAVAVEQTLQAPLVNPDTGRKSRTFTLAGKLDVIATRAGRLILIDHKTTSDDISDPNAAYWRQLAVEGQINQYYLLGWQNGWKFDAALWDVVRKPLIRPKKLSKADRQAIVATKSYCFQEVSAEALNYVQQVENESLELYEGRLAADCMSRPEWYFARRTVNRLDSEILEHARDLWGHSQDILASRQNERHPRNSGACLAYGSACSYLGICSGFDTSDSDNWRRSESVHDELDGVDSNALTNSRIRCFQTCRRKHLYRYELGLRRNVEEDREALYFGTLWHLALEAFWRHFLVKDSNDSNTSDTSSSSAAAA